VTDLNSLPLSNDRSSEPPKRRDADTNGRLVGLLGLGALTLWIIVTLSNGFHVALASQHWPRAIARITSSAIYTKGAGVGVSWIPTVEYEYGVGGTIRRASNIRFLMRTFYNADDANEVQSAYPAGRLVSIAYNPQDPNQSVLEAGIPHGMLWSQPLIPIFFLSLCGYIFYEISNPQKRRLLLPSPIDLNDRDDKDEETDSNQAEMA